MRFKLNNCVTKSLQNDEALYIFNWQENVSAIITDKEHPAYQLVKENYIECEVLQLNSEYREDLEWLQDQRFIVNAEQLLDTNKKHISDDSNAQNVLHIILLPSGEACNLRCVYCYEDHAYKKRMTSETADILISFIKQRSPDIVHIEYFGGEPMLNLQFIKIFAEKLVQVGILFKASMTTNGTLLNEANLKLLYASGIRSFQITIDGARELHNSLRVSNSKNLDSYESVSNALRVISRSNYNDLSCMVRINANDETVTDDNLASFLLDFKSIVSPEDKRFFILPKPIGDYLSANLKPNLLASDSYCNKSSISNVVSLLEDRFFNEGYTLGDPVLLTQSKGYACYAGNENSFVITPELNVLKCTVALDDPLNNVGNLDEMGTLHLNSNFNKWVSDYSDIYCESCFAFDTCTGNSCPLANIKNNKKICPPIKNEQDLITTKIVNFYQELEDE